MIEIDVYIPNLIMRIVVLLYVFMWMICLFLEPILMLYMRLKICYPLNLI